LASSFASNSFLSKDFKIYILVEYFWYFIPFANQSFLFEIEVLVVVNALIFSRSKLIKYLRCQMIPTTIFPWSIPRVSLSPLISLDGF